MVGVDSASDFSRCMQWCMVGVDSAMVLAWSPGSQKKGEEEERNESLVSTDFTNTM